jgi:hypothetical protein
MALESSHPPTEMNVKVKAAGHRAYHFYVPIV